MKKYLLLIILSTGCMYYANAQMGVGTPTPTRSAFLEVFSGDKGVLIPRVALTSTASFSPITGDAAVQAQSNSLLVYNTAAAGTDPNAVTPGFYYWVAEAPGHWERIVNQAQLDEVIQQFNADLDDIRQLINYIVPTNPGNTGGTVTDPTTIVYDPEEQKFFYVTYDVTNGYTSTEINLQEIIAAMESETHIDRTATGDAATGDVQITYDYFNEADIATTPQATIDVNADLLALINGNTEIKEAITNILNTGGAVFYGDHDSDPVTTDVLYTVDGTTHTTIHTLVVVQGIADADANQTQSIKNTLGNDYTNTVVNTGDTWIDNGQIFKGLYDGAIASGTAELTAGISLAAGLPSGAQVGSVISIRLLDATNNTIINTATTDVNVTGNTLSFRIGTGNVYNVLSAENDLNIKVLVEFSAIATTP